MAIVNIYEAVLNHDSPPAMNQDPADFASHAPATRRKGWLEEWEMQIIAQHHAAVVHNPATRFGEKPWWKTHQNWWVYRGLRGLTEGLMVISTG